MWLPPTPPSDDSQESHIDAFLEMKYDTQSVISPAVLAAIAPFRYRMQFTRLLQKVMVT